MQNQVNYYHSSGQFNVPGFLLAFFICIAFSVVAAYAYTLISTFSPIIYLNVLLGFFLGVGIGIFVNLLSKLTHLRNELSRYILTVFTVLLCIYFSWVAFVLYASMGRMPSFTNLYLDNLILIADNEAFFGTIKAINKVGLWEVFGLPFNGIILTLIWLSEIFIILGAAVMNIGKTPIEPYAEDQKKWYDKFILQDTFNSVGAAPDLLVPKLLNNPVDALKELGGGTAWKYTQVSLYYLPQAKEQYVSVDRIYIADRGEGKTEKETIIPYLSISTSAAQSLLDTYDSEKAGWFQ